MSFLRKLNSVYSKIHKVKNYAPTCCVSHETANQYGGSGTYQVFAVALNQIHGDAKNCGNASVSSSEAHIDAGTYTLHAWCNMFGNDHAKTFLYNSTLSSYIDFNLSGLVYANNDGRTVHIRVPKITFLTRTSLQVRVLNEANLSSALAGGNFDEAWDPGSNQNGHLRPGTLLYITKLV